MQLNFFLAPASVTLQIVALSVLAGSNLSPIWLVFLSPLFVLLLTAFAGTAADVAKSNTVTLEGRSPDRQCPELAIGRSLSREALR